jgi:hypothetical protein
MSYWTAKEHACKYSVFLHVHISLYDLIHPLLTLILEKILIEEIHI